MRTFNCPKVFYAVLILVSLPWCMCMMHATSTIWISISRNDYVLVFMSITTCLNPQGTKYCLLFVFAIKLFVNFVLNNPFLANRTNMANILTLHNAQHVSSYSFHPIQIWITCARIYMLIYFYYFSIFICTGWFSWYHICEEESFKSSPGVS